MTLDKDRKRIIRNRMKGTGESYTTARLHVVEHARKRSPRPAAAARKVATIDYATVAGKSDATITEQTGHTWAEWIQLLDAHGAKTMTHGEIARLVHEKYGVSGWWSQTVTVGYERLTGRRTVGQRTDGAYELSKSKTFDVPVATLFGAWADDNTRRRWLDRVDTRIRTATSPKSMRLQWPDGTIVAVWFTSKGPAKSTVALAHTKLASKAALEQSRGEWTARLDSLARLLGHDRR